MAIPDFQSLMLPLLQLTADGKIHNVNNATDILAQDFNLTEEEKARLIPSGSPKFYNRVGWAKTHLKKAGLLDYPQRGYFEITQRGLDVLQENPPTINMIYLKRFLEYETFRKSNKTTDGHDETDLIEEEELTPEEALENAFQRIQADLADELLETIKKSSPAFFEKLVIELLVAMGYGGTHRDAAHAVGGVGDGGIDGIINQDKLGLETIYIQAKKWHPDNKVSRPQIQAFVGALTGKNAHKGVFITTSDFSKQALSYVSGLAIKVVLINGERLATLMIDYGIGVSTRFKYEIKTIDSDYFGFEL